MRLLKLPLWDFFKDISGYPQYFDTELYWIFAVLSIILFIITFIILWIIYRGIYHYLDKKGSVKETVLGELIDKKYIGEMNYSGSGTAIIPNNSGGIGVGVVSTSSHSDEQFLFFVNSEQVYKLEVDMQSFYKKEIGDEIMFAITVGGLSKKIIKVEYVK